MSENAVCAVAIFIFRRIFGANILLHTLHHLLGLSFDMLGSDIEYELRPLPGTGRRPWSKMPWFCRVVLKMSH